MVLHNLLYNKGYNCQESFIKDLYITLWTSLLEIPGGQR